MEIKRSSYSLLFIFLLFICITSIFELNLLFRFDKNNNLFKNEIEKDLTYELKNSEIYNISGYISIDDTNPLANWEYIKANYEWLNVGDGSKFNPYIIEEVWVLNPPTWYSCITIKNSRAYFIVRDSILRNSNGAYGITLNNVTNGKIVQNDLSYNDKGMLLTYCNDTWISGNQIDYVDGGISLVDTNNCFIYDNLVSSIYGWVFGISIQGNNNTILKNNISNYTYDDGIIIEGQNNNISFNKVLNNKWGITISGEENSIIGNIVNHNEFHGIGLQYPSYNNFVYKNVASKNRHGIRLLEVSINNSILENQVSKNDYGIELYTPGSHNTVVNNTISKNNASNNRICGIRVKDAQYNNITGNFMDFCGIFLEGDELSMHTNSISNTNLVNDKNVYFYQDQINLWNDDFTNAGQIILINCSNSQFSNLDLSHGTLGVVLIKCNNIYISNIHSSNNRIIGIFISEGSKIDLVNCVANHNGDGGILIQNSNNCSLNGNEANNNKLIDVSGPFAKFGFGHGIFMIWAEYSYILNNIAKYNIMNGIAIDGGLFNVINKNIADYNNETGFYINNNVQCYISQNQANANLINGMHIRNCNYNLINNNTLAYHIATSAFNSLRFEYNGLLIESSSYNNISGNKMDENDRGLHLYSGSNHNNVFENEYIGGKESCVYISLGCQFNLVSEENIRNGDYGIYIGESSYNLILQNKINDVDFGIHLEGSTYNNITHNSITVPSRTGIWLLNSHYNRITENIIREFYQGRCIVEEGDCIGNIFENNECKPPTADVPGFDIFIIISLVCTFILLYRKRIIKSKEI